MPAGAIEDQHSMRAGRDLGADFGQVLVHGLDVGRRHDDGSADTAGGADSAEQVDGVMAIVAPHCRA